MTTPSRRILLAGANERNLALLQEFLEKQGYSCSLALGMAAVDATLDSASEFDLALVDVTGMDANIWSRCQQLHDRAVHLLVVSPRQNADLQRQGIAHGAHGVLVKPLVMRELSELVRTLLAS